MDKTNLRPSIYRYEPCGFDYKNQAWFENGVYVTCGHPDYMDCQCYGKLHEGERVKQ